jgi:hypothetical protein
VEVIDGPPEHSVRLGPDYLLWLGGSLVGSLLLGILGVWLYGFLSPRKPQPAYVTLSGVHMYPQEVSGQIDYKGVATPQLPQDQAPMLGQETGDSGDADEDKRG